MGSYSYPIHCIINNYIIIICSILLGRFVIRTACLTFAIGLNYVPYDILPNDNVSHVEEGAILTPQEINGFGIDFAKQVCRVCGIQCNFVYSKYSTLWNANGLGKSMHDGLYDAASMYTHTWDREHEVSFGEAFTKSRPAGLLSRMERDAHRNSTFPVVSSMSDLAKARVGIIHGWATR